ncbi:coiled-coil domain-containing protein 13-like [Periplaneta americana]|uniref:coiled-coil domain-containing protein 13-like n=1 Tax=Periplaneta americana TaxID=6978 RepID=UPI0037E9417B
MTMPGLAGTSRASEMAASKIVELSKRVRELTAEVEGHKSRHRAAEAKLAQYIEASQTALSSQKKEQSQDNGEKQEDQVRMLTEKLNSTSSKLYECRNQCQQLKQDLKMAQKVLSSEIGDNVSIHSLTSGNSNWRGRAQQIIALQQKISELKERLGEHNDDKTGCNKGMTTLRQIERERRAAHEQTERELKDVNAQLEDSKKKADGARARVKILEGELASVKGKLKTILEKGSHDDQLIKALTGQVNLLEKNAKEHAAVLHTLTEKHEKERESLLQNLAEEKSKTQDMHAILLERNEAIDKLEKRLMDERETVAQYKSDKLFHSNNQESIGSCKSTAHSGETPKSPKLDGGQYQVLGLVAEAERVRLIELLAVTNRRLEEQRKKAEDAEKLKGIFRNTVLYYGVRAGLSTQLKNLR